MTLIFQILKYAQAWNMKHILLNNLGSKQSLEFDQFI